MAWKKYKTKFHLKTIHFIIQHVSQSQTFMVTNYNFNQFQGFFVKSLLRCLLYIIMHLSLLD